MPCQKCKCKKVESGAIYIPFTPEELELFRELVNLMRVDTMTPEHLAFLRVSSCEEEKEALKNMHLKLSMFNSLNQEK